MYTFTKLRHVVKAYILKLNSLLLFLDPISNEKSFQIFLGDTEGRDQPIEVESDFQDCKIDSGKEGPQFLSTKSIYLNIKGTPKFKICKQNAMECGQILIKQKLFTKFIERLIC